MTSPTSMMSSAEVRTRFIEYFKKNGHAAVASSSLIPEGDPTLLFTNAGMNQFKNTFLGLDKRAYNRAVSSQKCVRAGGKHNDLDNVGFTARHHTFFEMLGNFSFGDYFKKDAIRLAWEFLTKELGIPKEKLYVTVFETDDEAADIWHKQEGIPRERIFRFGEKDNFWRMGDTGPCGPCSEIFYDHGPDAGKESDPYKGIAAGEDRFVEIWNLVFMQFFEKAPGQLEPLPKPSVDTGAGLERVVAAMQGTPNNYNTDLFRPMILRACEIAGLDFEKLLAEEKQKKALIENLAALRVLADHTRSCSFLIADGASPSNEGRGYVLRRIMRRAIRYGRKLTEKHSLLPAMAEVLIAQMSSIYPELKNRSNVILQTLKDEESRFLQTLDQGTQILNDELSRLKKAGQKTLPGEVAFKLYDTYGFPVDLTDVMAAEQGFEVDTKAFESKMEEARTKAKSSWKGKAISADASHLVTFSQEAKTSGGTTNFTGYETLQEEGKVLALSTGSAKTNSLNQSQSGILITDKTPFYAEGGGQVGDIGSFKTPTGATGHIITCQKQNDVYLHSISVESGTLKVGDTVLMEVSDSERRNIASNHSATHLLHAALRKTLGDHVSQAGSLVDATRLRFDFTHNKPLSSEEIAKIEDLVNYEVGLAHSVEPAVKTYKQAIQDGALALFGEKYGDQVRVIRMGDFSTELCGGTHVRNTAQIRLLKVVSEAGVSSGVRRIEAITGELAVKYALKSVQEVQNVRQNLGIQENWQSFVEANGTSPVINWIEDKKNEIKNLDREIKKLKGGTINIEDLVAKGETFKGKSTSGRLVMADLAIDDRDLLSQIADQLKNKIQSGIIVVVGQGSGSHPIIVSVTKDFSSEFSAGNLLKELAQEMGGKGGGRPDFAQGAAPQREKLSSAFNKARAILGLH